jgi:hypothetical protein
MNEKDEKMMYAMAALMGLVSRGASPDEVREMMWIYADFAMYGKPKEETE